MKMELMRGDSLMGSAHSPMYDPHILPLITKPVLWLFDI